jgi:transcription initiation factor TFIID TATA-box-binding protein
VSTIKVENVIAASHLGKELELITLATELPNARYSSSGNPSVIIEMDTNSSKKAAGVLFSNGKALVTGVTNLNEGKSIMLNLKKLVKKYDSKISTKRATKLENMVVKENIGMIVDLKAMALAIPGSEYDPLRFQGLILRMEKPEASFIIFESGVLIVTDIVSEAKAKKALKELKKFMTESGLAS